MKQVFRLFFIFQSKYVTLYKFLKAFEPFNLKPSRHNRYSRKMLSLRLFLMFFLVRNPFVTHQSERLILAGSGIRRQGVSYAYFAVHKFQYLQGSPLESSCEVDKPRDCALACVNNPPCSSFNLGLSLTAKGKLQCELLSEDKYRNAGKIFHSQQFHHYSIKVNIKYDSFIYKFSK